MYTHGSSHLWHFIFSFFGQDINLVCEYNSRLCVYFFLFCSVRFFFLLLYFNGNITKISFVNIHTHCRGEMSIVPNFRIKVQIPPFQEDVILVLYSSRLCGLLYIFKNRMNDVNGYIEVEIYWGEELVYNMKEVTMGEAFSVYIFVLLLVVPLKYMCQTSFGIVWKVFWWINIRLNWVWVCTLYTVLFTLFNNL